VVTTLIVCVPSPLSAKGAAYGTMAPPSTWYVTLAMPEASDVESVTLPVLV
jgi:hypothetical protein